MNKNPLWSIRLGFSNKQAFEISRVGLNQFLDSSFHSNIDLELPEFLRDDPKKTKEIREFRKKINQANTAEEKKRLKRQVLNTSELKIWWIDKMRTDKYPLREKMVCFWHNHFVSTGRKVKVSYWLYQHHMILQKNAFGNFKELTKEIIKSNAMVRYLDNVDNRKGKINENLSREMLELFTLGIGNYTEEDIKNGAKALAGLGIGDHEARYRKKFEIDEKITYLGKSGRFKVDNLIDIIFEQKNAPYLITKKILKWFIYDNPSDKLIEYYGDYLRKVNFEIEPLLTKIFTEEYEKDNAGSKIKDPLVYILQLLDELQLEEIDSKSVLIFLKQQGMDLFDQPNVKGWDGGNSWITSQTYLQRNKVANLLCNGNNIHRRRSSGNNRGMMDKSLELQPKIEIKSTAKNNRDVIVELSDRLLFQVNESLLKDMETILKYDFDPKSKNAQNAVLRLFNYMVKTPEFQVI